MTTITSWDESPQILVRQNDGIEGFFIQVKLMMLEYHNCSLLSYAPLQLSKSKFLNLTMTLKPENFTLLKFQER